MGPFMKLDIHLHEYDAARLDRIERLLFNINQRTERNFIMTREEAKKLDAITNAIKTRIEALLAKHADDLTPEEQAEVDADFATLDQLGKDVNNPLPPMTT